MDKIISSKTIYKWFHKVLLHLWAHSMPFSPSSKNSLMVEGTDWSKAFRSTTEPFSLSTPTLTLPTSPCRKNWTKRMLAEVRVRVPEPTENTWLSLLKLRHEPQTTLIYIHTHRGEGTQWERNERGHQAQKKVRERLKKLYKQKCGWLNPVILASPS